MSNEWLAGIQVASVIAYVVTALALYRLVVQQKDAHIAFLERQLDEAQSKTADELTKTLEARVTVLLAELARMNEDKATTEAQMGKVVENLATIKAELVRNMERLNGLSAKLGAATAAAAASRRSGTPRTPA